jgi:hypothetical protein
MLKDSMVKNGLTTLLLLFCVPAVIWAQTFTNDEYGYSIEVDDSLHLTRNNNATYFRSKDSGRIVIIRNWPGLDADTAREYLQQGYQDERIAFVSASEPEEINVENGKGLLVDIQGVIERRLMKGVAGSYIGNNGQGMVLVVAGSSEDWDKLTPMAQEITASIKFIDAVKGPDARDWYYMLAGTRLSSRGASDDKSRREDLSLCSDGGFQHRISASAMNESDSGSAFGHSTKTRSGTWRVVDDGGNSRLLLLYNDGRDESAIIENRSGQIYLDGRRYHKLRKSNCR